MEIFLKGIGVGLAVAAPVGPIGILCIRRTLMEGRFAGLATGFGAAAADGVYGIMVAAGFALTGVLVSHAELLKIGGGALIMLLGMLSIRTFFAGSKPVAMTAPSGRGLLGAFSTTFALTLSNPMTILSFVGLVAGLGASVAGGASKAYWLVLGVFLGSALWWLFLVHIALVAKSRLSPDLTRWLDVISGAVLTTWGLWIVARASYS